MSAATQDPAIPGAVDMSFVPSDETTAEQWDAFLGTLDDFTREQVDVADALAGEKVTLQKKLADNRELLRLLSRSGKIPTAVVESFYTTKEYKPRKKKTETPAIDAANAQRAEQGKGPVVTNDKAKK
jgi:hypothetical protein